MPGKRGGGWAVLELTGVVFVGLPVVDHMDDGVVL